MKPKNITVTIILSLFALGIVGWSAMPGKPYATVSGKDGVWDLRDFDFTAGNAHLDGLVRYIPDALLTPNEFATREGEAQTGRPEDAGDYATSKIAILLPGDGYYSFSMPSVDFSERLYVNGQWIWDVGSPGETKETTVPNTATMRFTAKAENGVIEIVRQSASFLDRQRLGALEETGHIGWLVGLPASIAESVHFEAEMALVAGCYFALFLIHLMLYAMLHRYRANLCASLLCLTWFLRSGVVRYQLFSTISPALPWIVKLNIEYLSLPITALLVWALMNELFPGLFKKLVLRIVYATSLAAVLAVLFLMGNAAAMSGVLLAVQIVYALSIVYLIAMLLWKLRGAVMEQKVYIAGMALMAIPLIRDMFFPINSIFDVRFDSERAMLVFAFFAGASVVISTVRMIEEAKAQEQQLAAENAALDSANRLKADIMATISHETRTPIAVISSYTELIAMELRAEGVSERHAQDLDSISDEIQHIGRLMEEMQGLSQARDAGKSRVSLSDILSRTARLYEHILARDKTMLHTELPKSLPPVYANPGEVTQVLLNLLKNAGNHTKGGAVTLSARACDDKPYIQISVADTGTGVAPELLPHVFERGVTGSDTGTGIGLAVCQTIIKAHGGEIGIESEPGRGAIVRFTLPVYAEEDYDE